MNDYSATDPILTAWAEKHGLHVYTGHRQNVVRSITVYVWADARHESTGHIWLDPPNELGLVGLHAANRGFRLDEAVPIAGLEAGLDAVCERLAAQNRHAGRTDQTSISPLR
ncbi:MAG TPA: hypothetical protein VGM72_04270 [Micropepsaceae bacterium]|jgi:hypothetical protein